MKRIALMAVLGLALTACATVTDRVAERYFLPKASRERAFAVRTERDQGFETADGVRLLADVHHPVGPARTPTILVRIPFTATFANRVRTDAVARHWAGRGYTVVVQGTRGRYRSGGVFYPAVHERSDGLETLRWLKTRPWHDGRLAMWGGSAFGHTQWALADQPDIDAFFVQIASSDYHSAFHPGGAFALESALFWALRSPAEGDRDVDVRELERGAAGFPAIDADARAYKDSAFFNDWALNNDRNAYWAQIDGEDRPRRLGAPMLLLGGWYDPFLPTLIEDYRRIRAEAGGKAADQSRLIIGPYTHAATIEPPEPPIKEPYRQASIAPALAWFDHLLGVTTAPLAMPRVRLFVMGDNVWRDEAEWPLARTRYTPFYLHASGVLGADPPRGEEPSRAYVYDPRDPVPTRGGAMLGPRAGVQRQDEVERRADVLAYSTTPLPSPVELTGPVKAILHVVTDAPSTDFTAKLVDVHPDGASYNISEGIVRRAYRPGEPTRIEIELGPTSMVFKAGHRIRIEVSSSNYPRFDRNPNTGETPVLATRTRPASQEILQTEAWPSLIVLPIIPR